MQSCRQSSTLLLVLNIFAIIIAYYVSLLLHEWGHGTVAWISGVKSSPFDIEYGGWLMMNADENVNYASLLASGRGVAAAMIGIAGISVTFTLAMISFVLLNTKIIQRCSSRYTLIYWFLMVNMIPLVQYLTVSTFSSEGDVGRFIHGLHLSGWCIFIPGTLFNIWALWRILTVEVPRSYVVIPIKNIIAQNIFLLTSLSIIFLFIYTHGYNPFSDKGTNQFSKILAMISIALVPLLFVVCHPSRQWVKRKISEWTLRSGNRSLSCG